VKHSSFKKLISTGLATCALGSIIYARTPHLSDLDDGLTSVGRSCPAAALTYTTSTYASASATFISLAGRMVAVWSSASPQSALTTSTNEKNWQELMRGVAQPRITFWCIRAGGRHFQT
jgi:hypothetical protein